MLSLTCNILKSYNNLTMRTGKTYPGLVGTHDSDSNNLLPFQHVGERAARWRYIERCMLVVNFRTVGSGANVAIAK